MGGLRGRFDPPRLGTVIGDGSQGRASTLKPEGVLVLGSWSLIGGRVAAGGGVDARGGAGVGGCDGIEDGVGVGVDCNPNQPNQLKELSLGEGLPGSSAEGSLATVICAFRWRGGKASGR